MKKKLAILGSTGSIGKQTLEVVREHTDKFYISALTANNNIDLLITQAKEFNPDYVVIANESGYLEVKEALSGLPVHVMAGKQALNDVACLDDVDLVLTALVGFSGLVPTIHAIECGKTIALANKETLVIAGELITKMAEENNVSIYPVDSEHSAIYQCLTGEKYETIEKIYLTASGGPFREFSADQLARVTKEDALKHPNWNMGSKITIDSASLMNKGLEAIEAKWLFDLEPGQINVIIHPQSIIHSMVQFIDGSIKAQMGLPDMRLPIQYAIGLSNRMKSNFRRFNFMEYPELTFEKPNHGKFPNLSIAFNALEQGGTTPCIMNAANEIVVEAFLKEQITFTNMPRIIEKTIEKTEFLPEPSLNDYFHVNTVAREQAKRLLKEHTK
jgi:1-deoxy-D-xylulose-5-phosphate reductoisomerase